MGLKMNLQLFGGRGGGSGMGGGGGYGDMKGAGYEGNFVPTDEYEAQRLQELVALRERWGRRIGSNNPDDHLMSVFQIVEVNNGEVNRETFYGTKMQFADKLNRMNEMHDKNINSRSGKYSVTGWEDRTYRFSDGSGTITDKKTMDRELNGPELRKVWKKGKVPY